MTITKITPDDIEVFTLETHPVRSFSSSSLTGPNGSIRVFPRGSGIEKEVQPLSQFSSSMFSDMDLEEFIRNAKRQTSGSANIRNQVQSYLDAVNQQSSSLRKQQEVEIIRFEPSFDLTSNTVRKGVITNNLMPYYRNVHPTAHFNYTNYHTLNFFTANSVPSDSVILYPNSASTAYPIGWYCPSGAFSFDFWINPRYRGDSHFDEFSAGTIMHLSSCYAVSLVTGSLKDENGLPKGFRIMLQLSHSADVTPTAATTGNRPLDLVFLSADNSLLYNHWHHVTCRWGTSAYNSGTGSIIIDGTSSLTFVIPSASLQPNGFTASDKPKFLSIGAYYEGKNTGTQAQALFFTEAIAGKDGIMNMLPGDNSFAPATFAFTHPLQAEVHELKVYDKYLSNTEIDSLGINGPSTLDHLRFYVPPFFAAESPFRRYNVNLGMGGIILTPFFEADGTTSEPFNIGFSYGVGGHYINLENFTKDFAQGVFPRLFNLTCSVITGNAQEALSANDYLYATGSNIKRNATILPCDNGLFWPNFNFLKNGSPLFNLTSSTATVTGSTRSFVNDLGNYDYGSISLRDLASTASYRVGMVYSTGSIIDDIVGARPESLDSDPGDVWTILQRTRDNTSNQVCFFDISNLYYGKQIKEKSLTLTDNVFSGTTGRVHITLKDDGEGNIYRADCLTSQSTWNSVGNVFYNEGVAMIKSPHLFFFGKDGFDLSCQGVQDIHILSFNLMARPAMVTSSSNPTYLPVSASTNANDTDQRFVYITGIYLHDDNLNVIMKTQFAQPIVKRTGDKLMFKVKMDF
jgi:hypothetical protein